MLIIVDQEAGIGFSSIRMSRSTGRNGLEAFSSPDVELTSFRTGEVGNPPSPEFDLMQKSCVKYPKNRWPGNG